MPQLTHAPDDIIFRSEGILYDASTLVRLSTDDPRAPAIYLTPDKTKAFLLSLDSIGIFHIAVLTQAELQSRLQMRKAGTRDSLTLAEA